MYSPPMSAVLTDRAVTAFTIAAGMFTTFLYLVPCLQTILGYSPLQAGLRFLPFTVLGFFGSILAGNLSHRVPPRVLMAGGMALAGVGLLLMREIGPGSDWTAILPGSVIGGTGIGMVNPVLASSAIGVVPPQRSGMAAGIHTT